MPYCDEADLNAGHVEPENAKVYALISIARSLERIVEFLGCNAIPAAHLDTMVQAVVREFGGGDLGTRK